MRINLTKKEIINSIHMRLGFSKKVIENLLEDFLFILLDQNIKKVELGEILRLWKKKLLLEEM